ncbi:MAG: MoaD/ThiS family protein [Burkholderiales bacterium]|nr:MoaD/ThiS family protein [Burkholderiales bacterium]
MQITFKLYAGLTQYLPHEARVGNAMPLELPEGTTVLQAMQPFNLPMKIVKLVLVNGVYIAPEQWATQPLKEGDVLAIWPPVAGG